MRGNTADQIWVRKALEGSQRAYAELLGRYQRPVFSVIVRMVRDTALAEDLAQDTFLKAFRALDSFDQRRKFSSWLFTIAHNTTIDHLRRKTPQVETLEAADEGEGISLLAVLADETARTPEDEALQTDLRAVFEQELRRLRPEYAEILVLRFQEGLAYEEIAEVICLPLGTVKTHLYRARRALAERMAKRGFSETSRRRLP